MDSKVAVVWYSENSAGVDSGAVEGRGGLPISDRSPKWWSA